MSSNVFHNKIVNSTANIQGTAENNGETDKVNSMSILLQRKWWSVLSLSLPSSSNVTQDIIHSFLNFHSTTHNYWHYLSSTLYVYIFLIYHFLYVEDVWHREMFPRWCTMEPWGSTKWKWGLCTRIPLWYVKL